MASAREVQNRIRSVKNIAQITRALEAVSASRVRRAQERVLASRDYAEKAWEIVLNVQNAATGGVLHPLLEERETLNAAMVVLITSDRGLAGAYNSNVIRVAQRFQQRLGKPVKYIAVGRKGRDSLIRTRREVVAEFSDMPADPTIADISPIAKIAMDTYLSGEVDEVVIAYTDFINMLTQSPVVLGWLPLTTHTIAEQVAAEFVKDVPDVSEGNLNYEYEPGAEAVLDEIVPRFTELQLYQALLESQASEHAARMTAMRNATDNASQLVGDLTLEYNKARQAGITNEILDIVGGASALEDSLKQKAKKEAAAGANGAKPRRQAPKSETSAQVADTKAKKPAAKKQSKSSSKKAASQADDLTKIEGIGKKMSQALIAAGIDTYTKLAQASEDDLKQAIEAAGMRLAPSIGTWAEQSQFAANGDWDGLAALQDTLQGGRRVD